MKSPNQHNINEWIFSYLEGDLSPQEESIIEEYLLEHPEYDHLLEAWGSARIIAEPVNYSDKHLIARPFISWRLVHQASVFAAIAVNAVLASLIVFGPREVESSYAFVPLQPESLNVYDSPEYKANSVSNSLSNSEFGGLSNINRFNTSGNIQKEQEFGVSKRLHRSDVVNYTKSSSNNSTLVNFASNASQFLTQSDVASKAEQERRGHLNNWDLDLKALPKLNLGLNLRASNDLARTRNISFNFEKPNAGPSKLQSGNDNWKFSLARNDSPVESKGGKNKFDLSNAISRIALTPAFLTNTRRQEYLVPGANRNQINFAHVGSDFSNSVYSNTYIQFEGKDNQLISSQLGADFFVEEVKTGLGVQMMYSTYGNGAIRDLEASITVSPKIILGKNAVLEPAMRLRMSSTGVDRSQIGAGNWVEIDRNNSFVYTESQFNAFVNRSIQQDLGFGMMLNTKWGYFGMNADNLMGSVNQALHYKSSLDADRAPVFFNAVAGTEYESINKNTRWAGHVVYQNHGELNKFWLGSRVNYKFLSLGAAVSTQGEPVFSVGMMAPNLSVLYSTDYAHSFMYGQKFWNHQFMLRLTIKDSRTKKLLLN